nr:hypothetical protein [Tanacetum cinerariifolium]
MAKINSSTKIGRHIARKGFAEGKNDGWTVMGQGFGGKIDLGGQGKSLGKWQLWPLSVDVIDEILKEDFDALLDKGSEILHSIKGTILEENFLSNLMNSWQ